MVRALVVWVLYGFPEVALMMYCGSRLVALRLPARQFWLTALGLSLFVTVLRQMPVPFGLHAVVIFLAYGLTLSRVFRLSLWTTVIVTAIGFFLLAIGEELVVLPVLAMRRLTINDLLTAPVLTQLAYSYLSSAVLILVSVLLSLFPFRLFVAPESAQTVAGSKGA